MTDISSDIYGTVESIYKPFCAIADFLHLYDMTAALTSTNEWSTKYKNKYVIVTSGFKSLVVRLTDEAPPGKGIT